MSAAMHGMAPSNQYLNRQVFSYKLSCLLNISRNFGDKLYQRHKAYLMEMMNVHRNRPGVIMWSMANEPVSNTKTADYYFGLVDEVFKISEMCSKFYLMRFRQNINQNIVNV